MKNKKQKLQLLMASQYHKKSILILRCKKSNKIKMPHLKSQHRKLMINLRVKKTRMSKVPQTTQAQANQATKKRVKQKNLLRSTKPFRWQNYLRQTQAQVNNCRLN